MTKATKAILFLALTLALFYICNNLLPLSFTHNYQMIATFLASAAITASFFFFLTNATDNAYAFLLPGVLFVGLGIYFIMHYSDASTDQLLKNGITQTAVVLGKDSQTIRGKRGRSSTTYHYGVAFYDSENNLVKGIIESYDDQKFRNVREGDKVDIRYLKSNPQVVDFFSADHVKSISDKNYVDRDLCYNSLDSFSRISDESLALNYLKSQSHTWTGSNGQYVNTFRNERLVVSGKNLEYSSNSKMIEFGSKQNSSSMSDIEFLNTFFIESKDIISKKGDNANRILETENFFIEYNMIASMQRGGSTIKLRRK